MGPRAASLAPTPLMVQDVGVSAKRDRRRFTAAYKLQILQQVEGGRAPGEVGALLRREGLYSSHHATWRAARRRGELAGLGQRRGPKPAPWIPAPSGSLSWSARWPRRPRGLSGPKRSSSFKRKSRSYWASPCRRATRRASGADDHHCDARAPVRHDRALQGARRDPGRVLPPPATAGARPTASSPERPGAPPRRTADGIGAPAHAAVRGPRARRSLCHAAGRRRLSLRRADDVPNAGRARRGARAARSGPPAALHRARTARHLPENQL